MPCSGCSEDTGLGSLHLHIENEIHRLLGPPAPGQSHPGNQGPVTPQQLPRRQSKSLQWIQDAALRNAEGVQSQAVGFPR